MPKTKISALIHTCDCEHSLGRALDSLRPCDEVIVVDHGSCDETVKVAREHGARVITAVPGVDRGAYAQDARNHWVLCLLPQEALAVGRGLSRRTGGRRSGGGPTASVPLARRAGRASFRNAAAAVNRLTKPNPSPRGAPRTPAPG